MADGLFRQILKALGAEPRIDRGSFTHDGGTGDPTMAYYPVGYKCTITRSATGTFSVKVPLGCGTPSQPHVITVDANPTTAGNWFECCVVGDSTLNASGRAFTVLTHRGGTALDPTGRVGFTIHYDNSTGR